jgi:hypothetical protein
MYVGHAETNAVLIGIYRCEIQVLIASWIIEFWGELTFGMAYAVINQPLRDVSIGTSAVTLCGLFRQYVATGSIKYMAHQLIDLALVISQVVDRVV